MNKHIIIIIIIIIIYSIFIKTIVLDAIPQSLLFSFVCKLGSFFWEKFSVLKG